MERSLNTVISPPTNTGASFGERSSERITYRNGYRVWPWGTLELQVPKVREGSYLPSLLEPRRRVVAAPTS